MWLGLALAAALAPAALPILSLPSLGYVPGYPVLLCVAELFFLLASDFLARYRIRTVTRHSGITAT